MNQKLKVAVPPNQDCKITTMNPIKFGDVDTYRTAGVEGYANNYTFADSPGSMVVVNKNETLTLDLEIKYRKMTYSYSFFDCSDVLLIGHQFCPTINRGIQYTPA